MNYNKTQILFALFAILAILYATNIFFTRSISNAIIDTPVKLSFTIIQPPNGGCKGCFNGNEISKMVNTSHNIKYTNSSMPYSSALSQKYIKDYGIKNLPAVIVSGDIANEKILPAWKALYGKEKNGRIIIENLLPYYDIKTGSVKGIVDTVLLEDGKCKKCFSGDKYIDIIVKRFGMTIGKNVTYDISSVEGNALVKKYNIVKVPMLMLSSDAESYPGFASSWKKEVGTIEKDGKFIFREVQKISPDYKKI